MSKKSKKEIKPSHVWKTKNGQKILIDFENEDAHTPINGKYFKDGRFYDGTRPYMDLIKYNHTDKKHLKKRRDLEKNAS